MAKPSPSHAGNPLLVKFGEAVRAERLKKGLSQEALADLAGLDRSYVGGVERGEHNITLITAHRIADALGVRLPF